MKLNSHAVTVMGHGSLIAGLFALSTNLGCTSVANSTGGSSQGTPSGTVGTLGSTGGTTSGSTGSGRTGGDNFESTPVGSLPIGFGTGATNASTWPKATEWKVQDFNGNKVLAHVGLWYEDPHNVFPVSWVKDSNAKDLILSVRIYLVRPPAQQMPGTPNPKPIQDGAGLVARFKDPQNYYLLRAVPYEDAVRFYKVVDGVRIKLVVKEKFPVAVETWHELKLVLSGNTYKGFLNGQELVSGQDTTFTEGAYGSWCKPNSVTYFDDFKAEIVR